MSEDRFYGFVQSSNRKTFKRQEKTDGTTIMKRSNRFDILNLTESGKEFEEMDAADTGTVDMVRLIWELPGASDRTERLASREQSRRRR